MPKHAVDVPPTELLYEHLPRDPQGSPTQAPPQRVQQVPEAPPPRRPHVMDAPISRRGMFKGLAAIATMAAAAATGPRVAKFMAEADDAPQTAVGDFYNEEARQAYRFAEANPGYALPFDMRAAERLGASFNGRTMGGLEDRLVGDACLPFRLPNGRRGFIMGDTFLPDYVPGTGMLHNTTAIEQPDGSMRLAPAKRELIPNTPDKHYFWPQAKVTVTNPDGSYTVYVPSAEMVKDPTVSTSAAFQFRKLRTRIAVLHVADTPDAEPVFAGMLDTISHGDDSQGIDWWTAATISADGEFMIVDGSRQRKNSLAREAYTARIKLKTFLDNPGAAADPTAYEYWDGKQWSKNPADAKPVIAPSDEQSGMDVAWDSNVVTTPDGNQMYVKTTSPYSFSNKIVAYVSDKPEGPYACIPLYDIPQPQYFVNGQVDPNALPYTYFAHMMGLMYDPHTGKTYMQLAWSNNVIPAPGANFVANAPWGNPTAFEPSVVLVEVDMKAMWAAASRS